MRTLVLFPTLLTISALFPVPSHSAERTWTIARDVYTAEGELVSVRGKLAYLRIDGKIEGIPIERLSALDQQYIASLSLAPIVPGPASELPGPAADVAVVQEEIPLPGKPDARADEGKLHAPDLAPAYGGAPIREQPLPSAAYRVDRNGRVIPPQPGVAANYLEPAVSPHTGANPNDRRYRRPSQQGSGQQAAKVQRNQGDNPGILGFRARRLERQRAAARSR